jgi:hypothetical protein
MKLTLTDEEVRQALINYVVNEMQLEDSSGVSVLRVTRHQGGTASADIKIEEA